MQKNPHRRAADKNNTLSCRINGGMEKFSEINKRESPLLSRGLEIFHQKIKQEKGQKWTINMENGEG